MRFLIAAFVVLFALSGPSGATPRNWQDVDLGQSILEGVASGEYIWLRGSTQKVVRFERATGNREVIAEDVVDLLSDNGRLWLLGQRGGTSLYYVVNLADATSASGVGPTQRSGDRLLHPGEHAEGQVLGLVTWPGLDRPTIVYQRGLLPLASGLKRQTFAASLGAHGKLAATDGQSIYPGYNRGEWGGGLRRVELANGTVSFVAANGEGLCEGALNPACDPIVGLFPDRARPSCVIVGAGISHLGLSKGDVYRVCGSSVESVFSTPTPDVGDGWMMGQQPWPLDGLFEVPDGWVGTSRDRYFRSNGDGVEERTMPEFHDWAGLRISQELDGFLMVVASCCWGSADNPTLYRAMAIAIDYP